MNKIQDIHVQEYTPKSLVVRGNTRIYKDQLKQLGGKYNSGLRDEESSSGVSPGWIFSKARGDLIDAFLYTGEVDTGEVDDRAGKKKDRAVMDNPPKRYLLKPEVAEAANAENRAAAKSRTPNTCPHCQDLRKEVSELHRKLDRVLAFFDKSEQMRKNMMAGAGNMMKNIFGATAEMMQDRSCGECTDDIYMEETMEVPFPFHRPASNRIMRPPPSVSVLDEDEDMPTAILLQE